MKTDTLNLENKDTKAEHASGNFVRLEDKYLLTKAQAEILIPILKSHLDNASPIPNTEYTVIESVYYDNSKLDVLTEYLAGSSSRSKMRTRRYAPNGVWSSQVFIEVKAKENGVCNKSRFQIGMNEVVDLTLGKTITKTTALNQSNPSIKSRALSKRIELVNNFVDKLKTVPASKITYSRLAYERGSFRVTLDQNLQFKNLISLNSAVTSHLKSQESYVETMKSAQQKYSGDCYIMEVKHDGNVPAWMQDFLEKHQIEEAGFSKYCYAMSFAVAGSLLENNKKSFAV